MPDQEPPQSQPDLLTPAEEALQSLLGDLGELSQYLSDRARHTYDLAQRFVENSQRHSATRVYDERQATMLEYQHYIWVEITGLVDKLLARYSESPAPDDAE